MGIFFFTSDCNVLFKELFKDVSCFFNSFFKLALLSFLYAFNINKPNKITTREIVIKRVVHLLVKLLCFIKVLFILIYINFILMNI